MVWGAGGAAAVSQRWGWRGLGAAQTTPEHSQGCKALSGVPLSLEEDVGDSGLHTPPFLLPM